MLDGSAPRCSPFSGEQVRRGPAREVLDVFIEGANVTAQVADTHASSVLRDLALALVELAQGTRTKAIVRFYDDPWEMCIERLGAGAALSVYRGGSEPAVAVYDRRVPFEDVVDSTREAVSGVLARGRASPALDLELRQAALALATADLTTVAPPSHAHAAPASVDLDRDAPLSFATDFAIRASTVRSLEPSIERSDVHALLFRGRIRAEIRGRSVELAEGLPFVFAERLVDVACRTLDAWERGQPHHVRVEAGGVLVGARVAADGSLALTLGAAKHTSERAIFTFPNLAVTDLVESALAFGKGLVRAILRRDRSQANNLRLSAFRRQLRETTDSLREVRKDDTRVNPAPEAYRVFARQPRVGAVRLPVAPPAAALTRLRYSQRWRALVPGIDLRSTFLCGDRLVIGAAAETFCLERASGEVIWRVETARATSVVTPGGVARLHANGELCVHDFGTGEITLRSWLAPRTGGPPAGAVVHAPALPRLLIVTEGERHLVAVDLLSGEPRWRYAWGRRGALRLKRAGKLLYVTTGESALTALDVTTGAVVWRVRDRLRFRAPPSLAHDALLAVAGGVNSRAHLHGIDPFSGHVRWTADIAPRLPCYTVEGRPLVASGVVACAVRERRGLGLMAFDLDSGRPLWSSVSSIAPSGTSWLAIDDLFVGNTPTGEFLAIDAKTGELRYRHVLGTVLETDVPRRLEPVLRSGGIFVPHANVHVFRPADGAEIGVIGPCEAIPDLLRVDERCDVYLAEESGHVAAFGAGARLSVVR
jgi:outer membrane protein assembly factor BamB